MKFYKSKNIKKSKDEKINSSNKNEKASHSILDGSTVSDSKKKDTLVSKKSNKKMEGEKDKELSGSDSDSESDTKNNKIE
jgi:hypothetical protein